MVSPSRSLLCLPASSTALQVVNLHQQRKGKRWSAEEDSLLRQAVQTLGEHRWRVIAAKVPGRSSVQCLHRWTKILRPGLVKGPWREEEDGKLRLWVQSYGPRDWAKCAVEITGRNGKQCRERWSNALDPALTRGQWTEAEDSTIFDLYCREGPRWSSIAAHLPGRSENAIKNRFYSNLRKNATLNSSPARPLIPRCCSSVLVVMSAAAELAQVERAQALAAQSGLVVPVPRYALQH